MLREILNLTRRDYAMKCYLIAYDIGGYGGDYSALHRAIQAYGTWAHISESFWAVVTHDSAIAIRNNLARFIGSEGRILVVKSGMEAAWENSICNNEWLRTNL